MSDAQAEAEMAEGVADAKVLAEMMTARGFGPDEGYEVVFDFCMGSQELRRHGEWVSSFDIANGVGWSADADLDVSATFAIVCGAYYDQGGQ